MIELEREKTYLAKALPKNLKEYPSELIRDVYIPARAEHPVVRLRQKGDLYEITKKEPLNRGDPSRQTEHTIALTKDEFEALLTDKAKSFVKYRYYWQVNGAHAEVDIYLENLEGLVLIDFEFESDEAMGRFRPPDVCLADMTEEEMIAGGTLAGKRYQDIGPLLKKKYGYKPLNTKEFV